MLSPAQQEVMKILPDIYGDTVDAIAEPVITDEGIEIKYKDGQKILKTMLFDDGSFETTIDNADQLPD